VAALDFFTDHGEHTIGDVASLALLLRRAYSVAQAETQSVFQLRNGSRGGAAAAYLSLRRSSAGQKPNTSVAFFNPRQVAPISYQYNFGVSASSRRDLLLEWATSPHVSHHMTGTILASTRFHPGNWRGPFAIHERRLDQPIHWQLHLPWRLHPRGKRMTAACRSWRTTRFRSLSTMWSRQ